MTTPLQVLKAAEEAEKLYREIYEKKDEMAQSTETSNDETESSNLASQEKIDEKSAETVSGEETPEIETPKPEPKVEDWKHKYEVLQGMYNKDIQDLRQKLDLALQKIDELTTESTPEVPDTSKQAKPEQQFLTELEADPEIQYLKSMYPDVWKAMSKVTDRIVKLAKEEVEDLSSKIKEQSKLIIESEKEKFYDKLDATVSNWEEIYAMPEFREWLNGIERYTGKTRSELLRNAYERLDPVAAAAFFEDFMKEAKLGKSERIEPIPKKASIEPRSAGTKKPSSLKPETVEQPKLTTSEIQKFYDDVQRGKYQGREKERQEMEAKIEKALIEGRII